MPTTAEPNLFTKKSPDSESLHDRRVRNLALARAAKKNHMKTQSDLPEDRAEETLPPRLKAIRLRCQECVEDPVAGVRDCAITDCPLYGFRFGHRPSAVTNKGREVGDGGNNARQAVLDYCKWCSGGSAHERTLCPATDCVLWRFRLGSPCEVPD